MLKFIYKIRKCDVMKNKRGFTLIELLAVIVILAIIALIAVPIVLKIISNSKESSAMRGAEIYIEAIETTVVSKQLSNETSVAGTYEIKEGNLYQEDKLKYEIKMKGTKPTGESVTINEKGKVESAKIIINGYLFNYNNGKFLKSGRVSSTTNEIVLEESKESDLIDLKVYGNSIQNGTPTPTNPVEVKSVGDKTVNIFDGNIEIGNYSNTTGEKLNATTSYRSTNKIDVEPNQEYCFSVNGEKQSILFRWLFYKDGNFVSSKTSSNGVVTVPDGVNQMTWHSTALKNSFTEIPDKSQIQKGSTVTEYEPYNKYKISIEVSNASSKKRYNIYLNEPLRKIGDNYIDYIDFKNKKVYRKVRELVVIGNETNWQAFMTGDYLFYRFKVTTEQFADNSSSSNQKCNYFVGANIATTNILEGASAYYSTSLGGTYFRIRDNNNFPTLADLKTFLKEKYAEGNPLKIYYDSFDIQEEKIDLPDIKIYDNSTIKINTDITPSKIETEYLKK